MKAQDAEIQELRRCLDGEATPILELMDRVLVVPLVYRRSPILR